MATVNMKRSFILYLLKHLNYTISVTLIHQIKGIVRRGMIERHS